MITKYNLMMTQVFIGLVCFALFYISGNAPAMILSVSLSLTAMQYLNDIEDNLE